MAKKLCWGWFLISLLVISAGAGAEKVIFSENFDKGKDPASLGWEINAKSEQSFWEIEDGVLKVTHFNKPYEGGYIEHKVPFVKKGILEFDAKIGSTNNKHLSLTVVLYGISTSFKGYHGLTWMRWAHHIERTKKITGEEPHADLMRQIGFNKWHHYRMEFDADTNVIESYVDNMDDPVFVEDKMHVVDIDHPDGPPLLRLSNYGLCPGTVINYIDNIKVTSLE